MGATVIFYQVRTYLTNFFSPVRVYLMKVLLAVLTFVFVLSIFASNVSAQTATTGASRRETVKERVETRKDATKDRVASRSAALKEKLAKFKDQKKAERVEKIDGNLNMINKKRTDHFIKFLDNASKILAKLETRVDEAGKNGKDTTAAKSAIDDAKKAIADAKAAVETQAAKTYEVTVSTESAVKTDAKAARDQLHNDLESVKAKVETAKKAVSTAISTAKTGLGGKK